MKILNLPHLREDGFENVHQQRAGGHHAKDLQVEAFSGWDLLRTGFTEFLQLRGNPNGFFR